MNRIKTDREKAVLKTGYKTKLSKIMNGKHLSRKKLEKELKKAYKSMGKERLKILKEWEPASIEVPYE